MKKLKIAVAAGTGDAVELINAIGNEYDIIAFAATEYGGEILKNSPCKICTGRLDENGFADVLINFDAVIDATHPFAVAVTEILKSVCKKSAIPYLRLKREEMIYAYQKIIYVSSPEEAAKKLSEFQGNIFLSTGVNTLKFYAENISDFPERVWARILDTEDSRRLADGADCHIIYGKPPFTEDDTLKILTENNIDVMVTKDSGRRGGIPQKLAAAEKCGATVIMIKRPEERGGMTLAEISGRLSELS